MSELPQTVLIVAITLLALTAMAIGIRVWDRFYTARVTGWDDSLIIISWISSIVVCSTLVAEIKYGLGIHRDDVTRQDFVIFLKLSISTAIGYSIGLTSAKASFAVLYIRLFPVKSLIMLNKAVIAFLLARAIEESLIITFQCSPIRKSWMPDLEGHCLELRPAYFITGVFNFITDIVLFIQPILVAWRLRIPVVKRVELGAMLSLGFLVTGISVIRVNHVAMIDGDETYQFAEPFIWSTAEICSLIVCSCVPSLRRVVGKISSPQTPHDPSEDHDPETDIERQDISSPLRCPTRKGSIRSKDSKMDDTNPLPLETRPTTTTLGTTGNATNQDGPLPYGADLDGAAVTARDITRSTGPSKVSITSRAGNNIT